MVYADEPYYKCHYLLGRKPVISSGFQFYSRAASRIIDQYTFGRLKDMAEVPEAVQMCCCELAEAGHRCERQQKNADGKTSEKVGTYSASFGNVQEAAAAAEKEQHGIIMKWLADTGLCYQGV